MKRTAMCIVFLLVLTPYAEANVGIFAGYGHDVELRSTEDIQMVSEEITITPGRGRFLFDGTGSGMDMVDYQCRFVLKNHSGKENTVQVGFPLISQLLSPPYSTTQKTSELIAQYHFIAQEEGKIYSVRYSPGNMEKNVPNLFLWDMTFKPQEEKELLVSYSIPITAGIAKASKTMELKEPQKFWFIALENCMIETFGYVTETGKSWKGAIQKATFRVFVKGFEAYLKNRGFAEYSDEAQRQEMEKMAFVKKPVIYRRIMPTSWKEDGNGFIQWEYTNYRADQPIVFVYYFLNIPQNKSDTERLIGMLFQNKPTKEDIEDFEAIVRAYYGEPTRNQRVKSFLEDQIWYPQKDKREIPQEVLEVFKQYK